MSKVSGVSITFDQADVRKFEAAQARLVKDLDYSMGHALNSAANALVKSLAASTNVAPKYRTIAPVQRAAGKRASKGQQRFAVTGWFGNPRALKTITVRAPSLAAVKKGAGKIPHRGLAKKSWKLSRFTTYERHLRGSDPYVKITNTLPFIVGALKDGARTVSSALSKAADAMMHSIDKQLERSLR